jgi:hypothetical protein
VNDRIKQLAEQAGYLPDMFGIGHWDMSEFQKFAELIVQECSKISEDDITDGDACCTNTAYRIARQIKQHFGVKE